MNKLLMDTDKKNQDNRLIILAPTKTLLVTGVLITITSLDADM